MSRFLSLALLLWATMVPGISHGQTAQQFFATPTVSSPMLSPAGDRVLYKLSRNGKPPQMAVLDLRTLRSTVLASYDQVGIGLMYWVSNERVAYTLAIWDLAAGDREFAPGLFAVNVDGTKYKQLVKTFGSSWLREGDTSIEMLPHWTQVVATQLDEDSDHVVVATTEAYSKKEGADYRRLKRLNTRTGHVSDIDSPTHASAWYFDRGMQLRAAAGSKAGQLMAWVRQDKTWRDLPSQDALSPAYLPVRWLEDDHLLVRSSRTGFESLYRLNTQHATLDSKPLLSVADYDVSDPEFIEQDGRWLGTRFTADAVVTVWRDATMQTLQDRLDKTFPESVVNLSVSARGGSPWVLVEVYSDRKPPRFFMYQRETGKLTQFGESHSQLQSVAMGSMDLHRIPARDGLLIPTFVTLPPGADKAKLPTVVLVHGGPWYRGTHWHWSAPTQFLATRGYLVIEPEFRGSTGFGDKHFRAGWKQWGQAMQDDITDATRWAIQKGLADPERICIMGGSYGGYAAMMGMIKEPDLYRCGISWVGVTDLEMLYTVQWSNITDVAKTYGLPRMVGDLQEDAAMLRAHSPLRRAAELKKPLMMVYGGRDERVPLIHGERMREALRPHNPSVEWWVYPTAGHYWGDEATQVDFWGRAEKFLAKHLPATKSN